ncbi:phosphate-regulating neutral endopeptidase PHEX-like [Ornithodoros turicata]|uniref:phosphate-regulating neutral endopeptidase PHEX-like n=1 Tax=Ornithodoros turicata TaxID=34597 RepID=UPI003139037A
MLCVTACALFYSRNVAYAGNPFASVCTLLLAQMPFFTAVVKEALEETRENREVDGTEKQEATPPPRRVQRKARDRDVESGPVTHPVQKANSKNTTALGVLIATFVIIALILYVLSKKSALPTGRLHSSQNVCDTQDCFEHARTLLRDINTSVDPCQDFSAFVCSNWNRDIAASVASEMRNKWSKDVATMLERGVFSFNATRKAADLFAACTNRSAVDKERVQEFTEFLRSKNIPWPHGPPRNVDPLSVLIDLDANFLADLWFHVVIRYSPSGHYIAIVPSPLVRRYPI